MVVLFGIQKERKKNLNTGKKWREIFCSTEQNNRLHQKKASLFYLKYFAFYLVRLSARFLYTQTFNPTVLLSITPELKIVVSYKDTHYNINIIFIHGNVVRGTMQRAR